MESLLKDDLTKRLESTSMLSKVQHGFSKGRSCLSLTNLLETFEAWTLAVDPGVWHRRSILETIVKSLIQSTVDY